MLTHGVNITEVSTSLLPVRTISASIPVVVGTAASHSALNPPTHPSRPQLVASLSQYRDMFGSSDAFGTFSLEEFARVYFGDYQMGPAIIIDCAAGKTSTKSPSAKTLVAGSVTLTDYAVYGTIVVTDGASKTYVLGTDYNITYDVHGYPTITRIPSGTIPTDTSSITVGYRYYASGVTAADIVTALDDNVDNIYPLLGVAPGILCAPGWSEQTTVKTALLSHAKSVSSLFRSIAVVDADTGSGKADSYSALAGWMMTNGYRDQSLVVCWPQVVGADGVTKQHLSTHVVSRMAATDADNGDVPYVSPSNKPANITGLVLASGADVILTPAQADIVTNTANAVTALNFNGWRIWGNHTSITGTTDPKATFVSIRRMFNWVGNNVVQLLYQKLDDPINRRTIETALDSVNAWLNGLVGLGALLAGQMQFLQDENPDSALALGQVKFHLYMTPPSPAEQINLVLEYDVTGQAALFEEA